MARPYLIVTGDFVETGGMDRANLALAAYLAGPGGAEVHLVTHRASPALAATPGVVVHRVPRPSGSHLLGSPLLDYSGRRWARRLSARGGRVVVNGGNCRWGDINWVHYVHAAWSPGPGRGGLLVRAKGAAFRRYARATERDAVRSARLVVANSQRTRRDVIEGLGVPPGRVHTVYYGTDPERFRPPTAAERAGARAMLGWGEADERPSVAFVGALGDARKGFDTLFEAWRLLARDPGWDARLVVVGAGATLPAWRARAEAEGLGRSIEFLGFRDDVPRVLAACDLLVSPTRYEAYGLNVQEALCCDLPAIVTVTAGVAERYPEGLAALLLPDPDDAADLAARVAAWRSDPAATRRAVAALGDTLRARGWDRCAAEIVALAGG